MSVFEGGSAVPSPILRAGESVTGDPIRFIGKEIWVKHAGDGSPGSITILEDTSPPHHGPPRHKHAFEEFFYILVGEFHFELGGERLLAKAGDFVHVPSNIPHAFQNATGENAKLLMVARPGGIQNYFAELAAAAVADPGNIAAMNALGARYGITIVGPPLGAVKP